MFNLCENVDKSVVDLTVRLKTKLSIFQNKTTTKSQQNHNKISTKSQKKSQKNSTVLFCCDFFRLDVLFLLRFCCCFVVVLFSFCCGFVLKMDNFVLRRTVVEKESFPHINSLVNSEFNPESTNKGNHRLRIIERFIFLSYLK